MGAEILKRGVLADWRSAQHLGSPWPGSGFLKAFVFMMHVDFREKHRARMDGLDESQAKKIFVKGVDDSVNEG